MITSDFLWDYPSDYPAVKIVPFVRSNDALFAPIYVPVARVGIRT